MPAPSTHTHVIPNGVRAVRNPSSIPPPSHVAQALPPVSWIFLVVVPPCLQAGILGSHCARGRLPRRAVSLPTSHHKKKHFRSQHTSRLPHTPPLRVGLDFSHSPLPTRHCPSPQHRPIHRLAPHHLPRLIKLKQFRRPRPLHCLRHRPAKWRPHPGLQRTREGNYFHRLFPQSCRSRPPYRNTRQ